MAEERCVVVPSLILALMHFHLFFSQIGDSDTFSRCPLCPAICLCYAIQRTTLAATSQPEHLMALFTQNHSLHFTFPFSPSQ